MTPLTRPRARAQRPQPRPARHPRARGLRPTTLRRAGRAVRARRRRARARRRGAPDRARGRAAGLAARGRRRAACRSCSTPAALTHTSVALGDACAMLTAPLVEVHISNVHRREPFRHHSYVSAHATGVIVGLGVEGYVLALSWLSSSVLESAGPRTGAPVAGERRSRAHRADRRRRARGDAGAAARPRRRLQLGRSAARARRARAVLPRRTSGSTPTCRAIAASARELADARVEPRPRPGPRRCPSPTASFDLVASGDGFGSWGDQRRGLSELARVLSPGGTVVVVDRGDARGDADRPRRQGDHRRARAAGPVHGSPRVGGPVEPDRFVGAGFSSFPLDFRRRSGPCRRLSRSAVNWTLALASLGIGIVVGLTGMGGGALMTPVLVLFFHVPPLAAVSSDLVASAVMKPVGSVVHLRQRHGADGPRALAVRRVGAGGVRRRADSPRARPRQHVDDRHPAGARRRAGDRRRRAVRARPTCGWPSAPATAPRTATPTRPGRPTSSAAPGADGDHRRGRRAGRRHDVGGRGSLIIIALMLAVPDAAGQRAGRHRPGAGGAAGRVRGARAHLLR